MPGVMMEVQQTFRKQGILLCCPLCKNEVMTVAIATLHTFACEQLCSAYRCVGERTQLPLLSLLSAMVMIKRNHNLSALHAEMHGPPYN